MPVTSITPAITPVTRQTRRIAHLTLRHPGMTSGAGLEAASDGETINPIMATSTRHQATPQHNSLKRMSLQHIPIKAITHTELDAVAGAGKPINKKHEIQHPFLFNA